MSLETQRHQAKNLDTKTLTYNVRPIFVITLTNHNRVVCPSIYSILVSIVSVMMYISNCWFAPESVLEKILVVHHLRNILNYPSIISETLRGKQHDIINLTASLVQWKPWSNISRSLMTRPHSRNSFIELFLLCEHLLSKNVTLFFHQLDGFHCTKTSLASPIT